MYFAQPGFPRPFRQKQIPNNRTFYDEMLNRPFSFPGCALEGGSPVRQRGFSPTPQIEANLNL